MHLADHRRWRTDFKCPVFEGERIVAVAGVINKAAPYDEDDARQFSLLMTGMWGLVRRKRYSDDLKRSEALYRTIFEATGAAAMILDGDGMIVTPTRGSGISDTTPRISSA